MKKQIAIALTILLCLLFPVANVGAQTVSFEPVVQGNAIPHPADLKKLEKCILVGMARLNWRIIEEKPGEIHATFEKAEGKIRADIKVLYSDAGYSIEYVDSKGLDANLKRKVIHRNYPRWIASLNKSIYVKYLE